jgi:hypothetical protein
VAALTEGGDLPLLALPAPECSIPKSYRALWMPGSLQRDHAENGQGEAADEDDGG